MKFMNSRQGLSSEQMVAFLENRIGSSFEEVTNVSEFLKTQEEGILHSIDYLDSDQAELSIQADPYWPKWNSPWWHMTLLYELGLSKRIPRRALENFEAGVEQYLHFFPFTEEEVPSGRDPISDVLCMCALATADRILRAADRDVDRIHPWLRQWYVRYQLPDGGYNCDESAYVNNGKSSMISTIHMMESMLVLADSDLITPEEVLCLNKSASYVIARKLIRSRSKGNQIMDPDWIQLTFPRFYELDILRALHCIVRWCVVMNQQLPWSAIEEVFTLIDLKMGRERNLKVEREFFSSCTTRLRSDIGTWQKQQPVTVFPLLLSTGRNQQIAPLLTESWRQTLNNLIVAIERDLISFE